MPDQRATDVLIVGGGPAGLATAIAMRMAGFTVTVADCRHPPIDKTCGEGLMPEAIRTLASLGVKIAPGDSFPFYGIRFLEDSVAAGAVFPSGHGLGVRRTVLHETLVRRAMDLGVTMLWDARVEAPSNGSVSINGCPCRYQWLIGADGGSSQVRRWVGLDSNRYHRRRFAFRRHYAIEPWSDSVEVYWADGCQIYVTPVNRHEVSVCTIASSPQLRLDLALAKVPGVARRLVGVRPVTAEGGALSSSRRLRGVTRGSVALVGDASGSVDAITGDGLCLAFRQALALAEALMSNDLTAYERAHRRIMRRPSGMSRLLLLLDRYPRLRHGVLRQLASRPSLFANLLALHTGADHGSSAWRFLCLD